MTKRKRMRLPNGFGQISEIKNRRLRKPFRAMVTVGKTEEGKPICKTLKPEAYFKTYNEAYEALLTYHKNPQELSNNYTMDEVFRFWYEEYKKKGHSEIGVKRIQTLWNHLSTLHMRKIKSVRSLDLKTAIESVPNTSEDLKERLKMVLNMLFDYAVMLEYTDKNYARLLKIQKRKTVTEAPHLSYTPEEMEILWNNKDDDIVKTILIQCYTGWRPAELLDIKLSDIDRKDWIMIGGIKTDAGKNRIVPICSKILSLVEDLILKAEDANEDRLFFFIPTYHVFYNRVEKYIDLLNLDPAHRPHDGRKTFITMAKKKGLDEYAIKRIVGHAIQDITEKVYTDRDIEWLKTEIEKL